MKLMQKTKNRRRLAMTAFLNKKKVILRLLGIQKTFVNYINTNSLIPFIFRLAYKSNFDTIIGTNDGSSIKNFLKEFTHENIKKYVETNGVEKVNFSKLKKNDKYKIIFLGRLEKSLRLAPTVNSI